MWTCAAAAATRPLRTGVFFTGSPATRSSPAFFERTQRTGATVMRVLALWYSIAPATQPAQWDPTNPADPNYRWGLLDSEIRSIVEHGFQPLVTVLAAPKWAQAPPAQPPLNSHLPDPAAFGAFAKAIATRYSGQFQGLPRVRWWHAWNEPNLSLYLVPQLENGKPVSPGWYRRMLNEFAAAVHSVHPDNLVVAGGVAPFRDNTILDQDPDWGPLSFMREMLCLSKSLQPTCSDRASFDVWATHPYTSGGPLHHAVLPNDVSLGDLPEMRRTLDAAVKAGHVQSRGAPQFWATEFSWDSNPPDPCAPGMTLLKRWISEGLYRMWANNVSLVVWLQLQDNPVSTDPYQSGFYFSSASIATARAKPTLEAFRFPFVALRRGKRTYVWAHTPLGKRARLVVEQKVSRTWKKVTVANTDGAGILQRVLRATPKGMFRARMFPTNEASVPFAIKAPRDQFFNPFGSTATFEPGIKPKCST